MAGNNNSLQDRNKDSFDFNSSEKRWHRRVDSVSNLLSGVEYDYISMALSSGDTVETYTFKEGGSGGTTVAVIVVTYTTSNRDVLSSVERTS